MQQQFDASTPYESFHVIAKRIRRRTLWLQDAAKQTELHGATSARSSVVNHIVDITKADLARLRILWQYSSPDEQQHRGAEYQELSEMLKIGLDCVTRQKNGAASTSTLATDAEHSAVIIDVDQDEEEKRALREIFNDLLGLHELTTELARGVDSARNELFAMEDSAKQALLNTDKTRAELASLRAKKVRRWKCL